jgi:HAE1 family hydrophobic/amphiphilic exporter-1
MRLSDLAVKRPVAIAMVFLVIILLGTVSMGRLNLDLFPELNLPMVLTMTDYEGVGPEEIENLLTRPIEGAIGTVNGVKNIHATSQHGRSVVFVEFAWGTDMSFAVNQIREKIDFIAPMLPKDAKKTLIFKIDPNQMPIMYLGLSGSVDLATLDKITRDIIKPRLERVNGVASVGSDGGVTREIRISAVPQRLQAYGLTLDRIVSYLMMENRNTSAGTVEEGLKEHTVRVTGEFNSVQEIEGLQIPLPSGGYVRLGDLARVEDTFKEKKTFVFMDGQPAVQITVQRQTDANTVKVSDAVHKELAEIRKVLPNGVEIKVAFDSAQFIRQSINRVTGNALIGAVLAVFVLLLFLRNIRSTLIIGTAIPISIIATFILMYFGGLTLNLISLGGLALGIGMMVDNAIVILENIYRYRQNGYSRIEAAMKGANEVAVAVTASTLTSIVVFLPIVYVEGMASQIFRPMALTVSFSLIASLMVALTLVPMLSSKILKVDRINNGNGNGKARFKLISRLSDKWGYLLERLDEKYRTVLHWAINHKKKVVFGTLILFIVSCALIPFVGMEFIPKQDTGEYVVNIDLPKGTALRETQRVTEMVEAYIAELPEHDWTFYSVGIQSGMFGSSSSPEQAMIRGKLKDKKDRQRNIDQVLDELREKCANIPGARIEIKAQEGSMGPSTSPIDIGIMGDNLEVLQMLSQTIAQRVKEVEGTREVKTSLEDGRPEISIKLNRQKADLYGINASQLASLVSTAVNGSVATRHRVKGEEIDVRVILDENYRKNLNDLENLTLMSQTGALVPLGEVADLQITRGPTKIDRRNQTRRVAITGDISGRDLKSVTQDIQLAIKDITLPPGVQLEFGGANKEMMESFQSLGLALILAIILVYMILAAQFEALIYPFVIMFAVPPTLTGVVFSLLATRRTLSVPTFIGIIMLAGIVVNNAIVLVDYINTLRNRDGLSRKEAILKAGPTRLRPILMTTLTTVLALIPSTLGIGEGAELSAPMATAVAGGLTFSTLITLVLIPCMYIILDDIALKVKSWFRKDRKSPSVSEVPAAGGE